MQVCFTKKKIEGGKVPHLWRMGEDYDSYYTVHKGYKLNINYHELLHASLHHPQAPQIAHSHIAALCWCCHPNKSHMRIYALRFAERMHVCYSLLSIYAYLVHGGAYAAILPSRSGHLAQNYVVAICILYALVPHLIHRNADNRNIVYLQSFQWDIMFEV